MLDYKIIVLLFSTSVNVLMAIFVLLKDHKKIVNIAYAFFSINVSLWALTNAIFQITNSYEIAFLSSLLSYISAIIGVASLLYLIIFLNNKPLNIFKKYYPAITTLLGIIFVLIPNFVLTDVNIIEKKRFLVTNWGLYLFAICLPNNFNTAAGNDANNILLSTGPRTISMISPKTSSSISPRISSKTGSHGTGKE